MRFSKSQEGQYRPLVKRAWAAHCARNGIHPDSRLGYDNWYRGILLDTCQVYTTREANGADDYDRLMLAFAEIVGDERQIDYWSKAPERRFKWMIRTELKKLGIIPGSPAAQAYLEGIMRHMHLDQLRYDDLPVEHLKKIFIALDKQEHRHRHDRQIGGDCMTQKTAAWKRGFDDYNKGVLVGDNPFDEKDDLCWDWMQGWTSAALYKKEMTHAAV